MKKNKSTLILGIIIAALVVLLSVATYAYWQATRKQTNRNLVASACINVTLSEKAGSDINLASAVPITDEEGQESQPYEFTIINNCDTPVNYTVALEAIKDDEYENDSDYIDPKYIKVMLNYSSPVTYDELITLPDDTDTDYEILSTRQIVTRQLAGKAQRKYELRLWLDEDTPAMEADGSLNSEKVFLSKIKIIAGEGITNECYAITSDGLIIDYNFECGAIANVPSQINGIPVTGVATNAFYTTESVPQTEIYGGYTVDDVDFSMAWSRNLTLFLFTEGDPDGEYLTPEEKDALNPDDIWFVNHVGQPDDGINEKICLLPTVDQEAYPMVQGAFSMMADEQGNPYNELSILPYCDSNYPDVGKDPSVGDFNSISNYGLVVHYKLMENDGNMVPTMVGITYSGEMASILGEGPEGAGLIISSLDFSDSDHLTDIRDKAFMDYEAEGTTLTLPENLEKVGNSAFQNFDGDAIVFNDSLKKIGNAAFKEFNGDELDLPSTVESIGKEAFYHYDSVNPLVLPSSLTAIGEKAFFSYGASSGVTLTIPNGVTIIEDETFNNFHGSTLNLPVNLRAIGNSSFMNYNGESLTFPSTLKSLGDYAFASYNNDDLQFPDGLSYIGDYAFRNYTGGYGTQQNLVIPSSVKHIGD